MGKARVGVRLKEAIGGSKSVNRSADLVSLTKKYHVLAKKIHCIIGASKQHHEQMIRLSKTRVNLADQIASITKGSPLYECAGQLPLEGQAKNEVCSYTSIHHALMPRTQSYLDKYAQFVINYAIEWEIVLNKRVGTGLTECEKLRRDLDHYQKKVESLRLSCNKTLAAGKQVEPKTQEKLSRNEAKLQSSKETYDKKAADMCILLEEVTDRSWRDVHPMLVKMCQFDATLAADESKGLQELNQVLQKLKMVAEKHDLKPQARLKDIETATPAMLSTRTDGGMGLTIEADPLASGAFGDMTSPASALSMPVGTFGGQGSGGYPVQVMPSPSGQSNISRNSSINSFSSAPMSTSDMMAIAASAAPPPTMEEVTMATRSTSISAPNSGNAPPLYPNYGRSTSAMSEVSSVSSAGPPVPAPSAPPPPPPAPMGLSMYSGPPPVAQPVANPPYAMPPYASMAPDPPAAHPWSQPPSGQQPGYAVGNTNPFDEY